MPPDIDELLKRANLVNQNLLAGLFPVGIVGRIVALGVCLRNDVSDIRMIARGEPSARWATAAGEIATRGFAQQAGRQRVRKQALANPLGAGEQ